MSRKTRRRSTKGHRWVSVLVILILAGIGGVLLAPTLIVGWVRGYVQQEAFKTKMEQFFGTKLSGTASLEPLRWTGDEVTSTEAKVATANGWQAEMNGLHLALDWNAFRQGTWRIVGAGADSLTLNWDGRASDPAKAPAAEEKVATLREPSGASDDAPAWLRRWLPTKTEVDGVKIDRFSLRYPGPWLLSDARLAVAPWHQETSTQVTFSGGYVETPLTIPAQPKPLKFNLTRAVTRLSRDQVQLTEVTLHWLDPSEITVHGSLRPGDGSWKLATHFVGVPMREVVTEDWRSRLSGQMTGDLDAQGGRAAPLTVEGDVQLREGVLTALPILDRLAVYTGVQRFKRLVLDIASSHVKYTSEVTQLDKIVLQSNGLLRIEGAMTIRNRQLDGAFMVGVTPETLSWIPGAQQHVFTLSNPGAPAGMFWTNLKITGTIDAPREDLSDRIVDGAGKALLGAPGEIVNKGSELLLSPILGKDAAKQPGEVIKSATDTLGKGVESGVKLLEGISGGLLGK